MTLRRRDGGVKVASPMQTDRELLHRDCGLGSRIIGTAGSAGNLE
jgi:hypothetical protein